MMPIKSMTVTKIQTQEVRPLPLGRYLSIAVRPQSYGFVVIEDGILIEAGVRECKDSDSGGCLILRLERILRTYDPRAIVLCISGHSRNKRRAALSRAIQTLARRMSITTVRITSISAHQFFRERGAKTKYEIAEEVVRIFPELEWKLPHKRKPWESEDSRMLIFDAAAVAIVYALQLHLDA